jgi:organic radical activating enzyme
MIKKVENNQPSNVLRIEYMLGNTCNQKCSYCFPGSNEGTVKWPEFNIVKSNLAEVLNHYKKYGKDTFNIFFVGGEPTLWNDFIILCKWLKENYNCILEISTNATKSLRWWTDASKYLDHINISVHHEYSKHNKIIKLADFLYSVGVFVNVDVLIDPREFDKCITILEKIKNSKFQWPVIAKVVLVNGKTNYNDIQLTYFNDPIKRYPEVNWYNNASRKSRTEIYITYDDDTVFTTNSDSWLTRNDLNYFKGWNCNLGVDHIKITNGIITGNCQQILFDKTYNINSRNFKFAPVLSPVVCSKQICGCTGEIGIKKWKQL